jgi:anti-sigma factor RsiW
MDDFFARSRLSAYLDGELTDAEMAEVARALEEQPELRESFDELKAAVDLLRRHGPVQAPARLHAAIMREIEAEPTRRPWFERLLGPLGRYPAQTLGVAVLAAAVLMVVLRGPAIVNPPEGALPVPAEDAGHEAAAPEPAPGALDGTDLKSPADQPPAGQATPPSLDASEGDELETPGELGSISPREEAQAKPRGPRTAPIQDTLGTKKGGTYVPSWEKEVPSEPVSLAKDGDGSQARASEPAGGSSPFAYRLTPSSPDVLRRLVALAEKLGGAAYNADESPLEPQILTVERNYARVLLRIPASRIESIEPYLKSMGGLVTVRADHEQIYNLDQVEIEIEVQYLP